MASKSELSPARRPRPRAIVEAEHGEPPVKLTSAERSLVNEALRRGERARARRPVLQTQPRHRAAGSRRHDAAPVVTRARVPVKFVAGEWDNESDENVIEQVTLTYDFFTLEE